MKCINEETVQRYIDKEVNLQDRELIERHLDSCPACKEKVDLQRQLSLDIRQSINRIAPGSPAVPQFVQASENMKQQTFFRKRKTVYSLYGACILLILFLVGIPWQEHQANVSFSYTPDFEYDSNLPIDKQPILIQEIDSDGKVTEYYLE
jgi:hypothetical protein